MSLTAMSTHLSNTARDGDATTPSGSTFQCLTTLPLQKFLLVSNLNFFSGGGPFLDLGPFQLVLLFSFSENSCSHCQLCHHLLLSSTDLSTWSCSHTTQLQRRHIQKMCYCRYIHLKTAFAKRKAWEHSVKHMGPDEEHMLERVSILLNCISRAWSLLTQLAFLELLEDMRSCWMAFLGQSQDRLIQMFRYSDSAGFSV